jgi:hypothetical protein
VLPPFVAQGIAAGLTAFGRQIKGFDRDDAVLTGVETRTSAPLRILRGEDLQSVSCAGLYPSARGRDMRAASSPRDRRMRPPKRSFRGFHRRIQQYNKQNAGCSGGFSGRTMGVSGSDQASARRACTRSGLLLMMAKMFGCLIR